MTAEKLAEEILSQCLAGRTLQVARIVASRYEQTLAATGVTPHQLTLLSMICKMGSPSASEMLPYLKMDQSTLSRNLDRMAAKKWLDIGHDDHDARIRRYAITRVGENALVAAHGAWLKAQEWANNALGADGARELAAVAHRLNPMLPGPDETQ